MRSISAVKCSNEDPFLWGKGKKCDPQIWHICTNQDGIKETSPPRFMSFEKYMTNPIMSYILSIKVSANYNSTVFITTCTNCKVLLLRWQHIARDIGMPSVCPHLVYLEGVQFPCNFTTLQAMGPASCSSFWI